MDKIELFDALSNIKEELFDASSEVKSAFNDVVQYFSSNKGDYTSRINEVIEKWKKAPYGPEKEPLYNEMRRLIQEKKDAGYNLSHRELYYLMHE